MLFIKLIEIILMNLNFIYVVHPRFEAPATIKLLILIEAVSRVKFCTASMARTAALVIGIRSKMYGKLVFFKNFIQVHAIISSSTRCFCDGSSLNVQYLV